MRDKEHIAIVLINGGRQAAEWDRLSCEHPIVLLRDPALFPATVALADANPAEQVDVVIFDKSIPSSGFVQYLSELPPHFTGDALMIDPLDFGILCTFPRPGKRTVRTLSHDEVARYIRGCFGLSETEIELPEYEPAFAVAR
ncbi:MAG TPA: hypothetical protein VMT00_03795 [Thermoanaerobaculia bacterium]|nr:hypothetical protein [Thermoanaerobaculia bacterium]